MKVLTSTTLGEGVLFNDSGKVWDDTEKTWVAAPTGTDAWPAENVIAGEQIESINITAFEIPNEASAANWYLVLYAGVGNNKNGAVYQIATKANYSNAAPVSQIPIPDSRTFKLRSTPKGLVGESRRAVQVGETKTFAVDFREDLAANGRIISAHAPTIKTGTSGGVTFGTPSKDKTLAKFDITGVTAGTYVLNLAVSYDSSDGGGLAEGDITLVVNA